MHSVLDYSRPMSLEVLLRLPIAILLRLMATQMHITDGVQKMTTFSIGKSQWFDLSYKGVFFSRGYQSVSHSEREKTRKSKQDSEWVEPVSEWVSERVSQPVCEKSSEWVSRSGVGRWFSQWVRKLDREWENLWVSELASLWEISEWVSLSGVSRWFS